MDLMDLIVCKTSGRLALQILHENAKRSEGCVLKRKCGDGDDAKGRRQQIDQGSNKKNNSTRYAKQKTRTQKRQIEETICSTFKQINDL